MIYLVAGLCLALVGVCVLGGFGCYRLITSERAQAAAERVAAAEQLRTLLVHIQAPTEAVTQHIMSQPLPPQPQVIPLDDDKAFEDHMVSKDDLADLLAAQEMAA